jgi:hypothetical protein
VTHLVFWFSENVLPPLLAGAGHASGDVRAAAFQMLSQALASLPDDGYHDAPLEMLLALILEALRRETVADAATAELRALTRFCKYRFRPDAHDAAPIFELCDHFFAGGHQLAVVACYQGLAAAGVPLTESAVQGVLEVFRGAPEERLFFNVLAATDVFLDVLLPEYRQSFEAFVVEFAETCDLDMLEVPEL